MKTLSGFIAASFCLALEVGPGLAAGNPFSPEKRLNNLVSELLDLRSVSRTNPPFTFNRPADGWVLVTSSWKGKGTCRLILDGGLPASDTIVAQENSSSSRNEAMRF